MWGVWGSRGGLGGGVGLGGEVSGGSLSVQENGGGWVWVGAARWGAKASSWVRWSAVAGPPAVMWARAARGVYRQCSGGVPGDGG